MEHWTTGTFCIETQVLLDAIGLGYTHVLLEAYNATTSSTIYYNEVITKADTNSFNESNSTHSASFENNMVSVIMDITDVAGSLERWTKIAGVTSG